MKKLLAVLLALTLLLALAVPGLAQEAALRVAVVLSGSLGDRSFYDSANAGLQIRFPAASSSAKTMRPCSPPI